MTYKVLKSLVYGFTIHFATINTTEQVKLAFPDYNLQYTLLLLIQERSWLWHIFHYHLQYTLLLLIQGQ